MEFQLHKRTPTLPKTTRTMVWMRKPMLKRPWKVLRNRSKKTKSAQVMVMMVLMKNRMPNLMDLKKRRQ